MLYTRVYVCVCGCASVSIFRSIKPFDVAELPIHLKMVPTAKQKENFKEDVQAAVEASRLSK